MNFSPLAVNLRVDYSLFEAWHLYDYDLHCWDQFKTTYSEVYKTL